MVEVLTFSIGVAFNIGNSFSKNFSKKRKFLSIGYLFIN